MEKKNQIIELEKRCAFQEHAIEELTEALTEHQRRIEELESLIKVISEKMESGDMVREADEEEPPPHY